MGQIAGSLTFEMLSWPTLIPDVNAWKAVWHAVTFLYPVERTIIALGATFLGAALRKAARLLEVKLKAHKHAHYGGFKCVRGRDEFAAEENANNSFQKFS